MLQDKATSRYGCKVICRLSVSLSLTHSLTHTPENKRLGIKTGPRRVIRIGKLEAGILSCPERFGRNAAVVIKSIQSSDSRATQNGVKSKPRHCATTLLWSFFCNSKPNVTNNIPFTTSLDMAHLSSLSVLLP